ncbi:transcription elongation factor spt5, partial [Thoreauomyces humboldtii]
MNENVFSDDDDDQDVGAQQPTRTREDASSMADAEEGGLDEEFDKITAEEDEQPDSRNGPRADRDGGSEGEGDQEEDEEEAADPEDDEEEDEDDDDEEEAPRAKKRRRKANRFIDEEAMVDDDEEEEEEEEDGFVDGDNDEDFDELQREATDSRVHRELDRRREEEELDPEELARSYKDKYGRSELNRGQYRGDVTHVPQSMLMPSVEDPKLWLCACREGKERESVFTIMSRVLERETTAAALDIYSVFARDSLKGYIYIEARQQGVVQNALDGLNHIYLSKLRLVPVDEMVDCLTIKVKENNLDKVHWFRAKKGKYAGDLGQVISITDNGETMLCRFVPRLDPAGDRPKQAPGQKRKKTEARPPAKLFNPQDYKQQVRKDGGYYVYNNEYFDDQGYLEKTLKVSSLDITNIQPTLAEISLYSGGSTDRPDLSHMEGHGTATGQDFQIGESVDIVQGAMAGIHGIIASIHNDVVGVKPDRSQDISLPATVSVAANELRKRFKDGDHVQVVKGIHKGERGLIVIIKDNIITLVSDGTSKPIEVLSTYLRTVADMSVNAVRTSPYDVGDLVFLQTDVAVITKIEGEYLAVLTQFGSTEKVRATAIRSKRDSNRAITNDMNGHPISTGASVDVVDPNRGGAKKSGTILHIFREFVFVKVRDTSDTGGIVVSKAVNVVATGVKSSTIPSYGGGGGYGGGGRGG